jgi:uncharacterized membrane protein YcgQ (UPF0703/DUF1980 family)
MAHTHDHVHDPSAYYTQQLCTIGICGGLGGVCIMLYVSDRLQYVLVPQFHDMVLWSGITLVALVAIRAIALWFDAGKTMPGHDHDHHHDHDHNHHGHDHHDHGHEHGIMADPHHHPAPELALTTALGGLPLVTDGGHDHDDDDHGHDHSHDGGGGHDHAHTWDSLKFIVLLIPIVLYFLGVPSSGLSAAGHGFKGELPPGDSVKDKEFDDTVDFRTLDGASLIPEKRQYLQGRYCRLKGQFEASSRSDLFTLVRFKMKCCIADAVPIQAVILIDNSLVKNLTDLPDDQKMINPVEFAREWVEVTGQIQFRQIPGRESYVTVIVVRPTRDKPLSKLIQKIPPERDPYL